MNVLLLLLCCVVSNEFEFERKELLTSAFRTKNEKQIYKKLPEKTEDGYSTPKKKFCNANGNTRICVFYHIFLRKFLIGILMKMKGTAIPLKLLSTNNLNENVFTLSKFRSKTLELQKNV